MCIFLLGLETTVCIFLVCLGEIVIIFLILPILPTLFSLSIEKITIAFKKNMDGFLLTISSCYHSGGILRCCNCLCVILAVFSCFCAVMGLHLPAGTFTFQSSEELSLIIKNLNETKTEIQTIALVFEPLKEALNMELSTCADSVVGIVSTTISVIPLARSAVSQSTRILTKLVEFGRKSQDIVEESNTSVEYLQEFEYRITSTFDESMVLSFYSTITFLTPVVLTALVILLFAFWPRLILRRDELIDSHHPKHQKLKYILSVICALVFITIGWVLFEAFHIGVAEIGDFILPLVHVNFVKQEGYDYIRLAFISLILSGILIVIQLFCIPTRHSVTKNNMKLDLNPPTPVVPYSTWALPLFLATCASAMVVYSYTQPAWFSYSTYLKPDYAAATRDIIHSIEQLEGSVKEAVSLSTCIQDVKSFHVPELTSLNNITTNFNVTFGAFNVPVTKTNVALPFYVRLLFCLPVFLVVILLLLAAVLNTSATLRNKNICDVNKVRVIVGHIVFFSLSYIVSIFLDLVSFGTNVSFFIIYGEVTVNFVMNFVGNLLCLLVWLSLLVELYAPMDLR